MVVLKYIHIAVLFQVEQQIVLHFVVARVTIRA